MARDVGSVALICRKICSPRGMPVTNRGAPGELEGGDCPALSGASARERCPNTGESSTGDQTIPRSVGGIVAVHLANIFHAAIVAHQLRNAVDQLPAIIGD